MGEVGGDLRRACPVGRRAGLGASALRATFLLTSLHALGCDAGPVHVEGTRPGCVNLDLDEGGCLLPWPSSALLDPSGHIDLPDESMPANARGVRVAPDPWEGADGFSPMTSMIVRIAGTVDASVLSSWRETDETVGEPSASPTLLIDTTATGHPLVRHFAEVEDAAAGDTFTTLYLRPAQRLPEHHHFVVAIRRLVDTEGRPVRPSASFAALRDGTPTDAPELEQMRAHFESEVFEPIAPYVAGRGDLVVAWDFWTGAAPTSDLFAMRDDAFTHLGELGCSIDTDEVATSDPGARLITGRFEVPYFLDAPCEDDLGHPTWIGDLDTDGVSTTSDGTCLARFWALIPASAPSASDVHLVQYGHGFATSGRELDTAGVLEPILERTQSIGIATDFLGLSDFAPRASTTPLDPGGDAGAILAGLQDLSRFDAVDHRIMQGLIAQALLPHVFRAGCADQIAAEHRPVSWSSDPTRWVGNSEGAIFGPTVAALAPTDAPYDRLALGVGGMSYPIMLPRSCDFAAARPPAPSLASVFERAYRGPLDRHLLMVMFATHWDRTEGASFAQFLVGASAPGILYQTAVDDLGTPEVAGEIAARTLELPVLVTSSEHASDTMPFGLAPAGASPSRAFVSFDFGDSPPPPDGPTASPAVCAAAAGDVTMDPHERVRRDAQAQNQIVAFFESGAIP